MPFNAGSSPVASNAALVSPFGDTSKLPHDSKQNDIVASAMITWLIGAHFLAARCYTKLTINRNRLGAREWTLHAAVVWRAFVLFYIVPNSPDMVSLTGSSGFCSYRFC